MSTKIIGIDLGGTHVRAGVVSEGRLENIESVRIPSDGSVDEVLRVIFELVGPLIDANIKAIGIGVPSVVDVEKGIVYDVQNIPSWKVVELKKLMEERYRLPVLINNDANCFALGEKYFGKGREARSLIGVTIGTGLGAGIIINDKLYPGLNTGAGEFGCVDYLDKYYEYYASGQFFENCYHTNGEVVFQKAQSGDPLSIMILEELGTHIGNAIKMILYTYCPELIILGGSISKSYSFFEKTMWERIHTYIYSNTLEHFHLEISELQNGGVLGAAALYYDQQPDHF
ncbi:MAG: ROK family protein [Ginsengibacter sp.]|jgi:glucokinase